MTHDQGAQIIAIGHTLVLLGAMGLVIAGLLLIAAVWR